MRISLKVRQCYSNNAFVLNLTTFVGSSRGYFRCWGTKRITRVATYWSVYMSVIHPSYVKVINCHCFDFRCMMPAEWLYIFSPRHPSRLNVSSIVAPPSPQFITLWTRGRDQSMYIIESVYCVLLLCFITMFATELCISNIVSTACDKYTTTQTRACLVDLVSALHAAKTSKQVFTDRWKT